MKNASKPIRLEDDVLYAEVVISRVLDCEEKTLQAWRSRGRGPAFVKIGRLVRYRGADVKQWINSRTVRSTSAPLPCGVV